MSQDELGKGSTGSASPQKDTALTPIEKSSEDAEADKKPIFNFDVNKAMGSVKDITDKVMDSLPFGKRENGEKPAGNKESYKNVNAAEDLQGSLNACFALYGEISMKRETISTKKPEADPALFDIEMEEDEFEEQAGLKNAESHKTFSSYWTGKKVQKNYETMGVSDIKLFKVDKENSKGGFMSILKPRLKRSIGIKDGYVIVGEIFEENRLRVKSKTHLERLFKLFGEKDNLKQLTLVFFNKELNPLVPPVQKTYRFEERDGFLKELDEEVTKSGGKMKLFYNKAG